MTIKYVIIPEKAINQSVALCIPGTPGIPASVNPTHHNARRNSSFSHINLSSCAYIPAPANHLRCAHSSVYMCTYTIRQAQRTYVSSSRPITYGTSYIPYAQCARTASAKASLGTSAFCARARIIMMARKRACAHGVNEEQRYIIYPGDT